MSSLALDPVSSQAEAECAREPIHIPGSIQPHGVLVVLDAAFRIVQVTQNAVQLLKLDPTELLGAGFKDKFPELFQLLTDAIAAETLGPSAQTLARQVSFGSEQFDVLAHRSPTDRLIVEFEIHAGAGSLDTLYPNVRNFIQTLGQLPNIAAITSVAAAEIRKITGFDRVLIYQFDEHWNGTVRAESRNDALPSYLDLRFPSSDIPAQARELYRLNRLRLIPDADYQPVPIVPAMDPEAGAPTDLSFAILRSVSPVHLQYMKNMGTPASMSISILDDGRLWGLISCHSATPTRVPAHVRTACDFVAQVLTMQIGAKSRSEAAAQRVEKHRIHSRLLARMAAEPNFIDGLLSQYEDLLGLTDAEGAAIVWDDQISTIGKVPPREEIETISNWLVANSVHDDVFVTNQASLDVAGAGIDAEAAAGMLAVSISQLYPSYIMWFRPEVVRTVRWGGDPRKSENPATGSLNPRKSFDLWRETVRHQAIPWTTAQVEAAGSLRSAIVGIVMRKAEEMAAITEELRRSNKELEAFSYSISHDLRAPFRHIVGFAELLKEILPAEEDPRPARYIETIIESAHSAGRLVDDLLGFSQVGRAQLTKIKVDMNKVVADALRTLQHEMEDRQINWKIDDLAPAMADPTFMRSVWQNLLANSIKYSRGTDPTTIEVTSTTDGEDTVFSVRDDGVGFDMAYVDKLFGVFQRLHRIEDYEGSGIGLANVKRIVERHGGRVWAEGLVGKGAVFYFALPKDVAGAS